MYHINNRKLIPEEMTLIEYLANKANFQLESNWKDHIVACPLTEGKIGSIEFNERLRNTRIPIDNWRTIDRGHFHIRKK